MKKLGGATRRKWEVIFNLLCLDFHASYGELQSTHVTRNPFGLYEARYLCCLAQHVDTLFTCRTVKEYFASEKYDQVLLKLLNSYMFCRVNKIQRILCYVRDPQHHQSKVLLIYFQQNCLFSFFIKQMSLQKNNRWASKLWLNCTPYNERISLIKMFILGKPMMVFATMNYWLDFHIRMSKGTSLLALSSAFSIQQCLQQCC